MPKSSTQHNGQLTINYDELRQIFQLDNPDYFLGEDISLGDPEMATYNMISSGIQSSLAPHFDARTSNVTTMKVYFGENDALQFMSFVDFTVPGTESGQAPVRHFAIFMYELDPNVADPNSLGINVHFSMHGTLESPTDKEEDIEFTPVETKCRKIVGKNSKLLPVDMGQPNNVKAALCYADSIFLFFLNNKEVNTASIQQWLDIEAFDEVNARYMNLLQRNDEDIAHETADTLEFDLNGLEGSVVFQTPAMKQ